jgi:hypothetical protein
VHLLERNTFILIEMHGKTTTKGTKTHVNGVLLSERNAINTPVSDQEPKRYLNQAAVSLETIVNREFRGFFCNLHLVQLLYSILKAVESKNHLRSA